MQQKFVLCRTVSFVVLLFLVLSLLTVAAVAATRPPAVSITLSPSLPSPELLGTSILWTATVNGGAQGHTYDYQFSAALQGQNQIVRDFDLPNTFTWVPWTVEGTYVVSVIVRDITQQPYIVYPPVPVQYVLNPIVTAPGGSAVNITSHPLVALFSAGPCTVGHSIRVRFQQPGAPNSDDHQFRGLLHLQRQLPGRGYVAYHSIRNALGGIRYQLREQRSQPLLHHRTSAQQFSRGRALHGKSSSHRSMTQAFPLNLFQLVPGTGQPFILWPTATDLEGNVVWYYPGEALMTRMQAGGNFFTLSNLKMNEYDLVGNKILSTNMEILNEQLAAKGYPVMTSFNAHETRRAAQRQPTVTRQPATRFPPCIRVERSRIRSTSWATWSSSSITTCNWCGPGIPSLTRT